MLYRFSVPALFLAVVMSCTAYAEIPVYGVLMSSPASPYWNAIELGLREGAAEEEAHYYLEALDNELATDGQLARCNSMLDRKPNVVLLAATTAEALSSCLKKAKSLNIPVIGLGNTPQKTQAQDIRVTSIVLTDPEETAAIGAEFIADTLGSDASGSVVIADASQKLKIDSFTDRLQKTVPNLEVIADATHGKITSDVKAIVASDSASTIAAINAAADANNNIIIVSLDDQADNPALLKAGKIHAAIAQLPYLLGKKAMEQASMAMNGGGEANVYVVPILLTKQALEDDSNPLLKFIR